MAKILFVSADGGAANVSRCVGDALMINQHLVSHVVQKGLKAENKPLPNKTIVSDCRESIEHTLSTLRPDIVVAGVSGNQEDITLSLSRIALEYGIPVVKIIDFWGTGMPHEKDFGVTRACVLDKRSRAYEAHMRGMPIEHIVATGVPQFDDLVNVSPAAELITDEACMAGPLITFVGPSSEGRVREILIPLIDSIGSENGICRLGLLWHPKSDPDSYSIELEAQASSDSGITLLKNTEMRAFGSMSQVLAASDLVVGSTSTEVVASCYLRRPTLSILFEDGENHQILLSRGMQDMPTSEAGASWRAGSPNEISRILRVMFNDKEAWLTECQRQQNAQGKAYQLDGKNTQRIVDVVTSQL